MQHRGSHITIFNKQARKMTWHAIGPLVQHSTMSSTRAVQEIPASCPLPFIMQTVCNSIMPHRHQCGHSPGSLNRVETQDSDNTSPRKRRKMLGNIRNLKTALETKIQTHQGKLVQGKD